MVCDSVVSQVVAGAMTTSAVSNAAWEDDPRWLYSVDTQSTSQTGLIQLKVTVTRDLPAEKHPVQCTIYRWMVDPGLEQAEASQAQNAEQRHHEHQQQQFEFEFVQQLQFDDGEFEMIRPHHSHDRRAFTLLEVLLALGLTVIVMALVGTALNSTLRLVEAGRVRTERDQLARAILTKIADDMRVFRAVRAVRFQRHDEIGRQHDIAHRLHRSIQQFGQHGDFRHVEFEFHHDERNIKHKRHEFQRFAIVGQFERLVQQQWQ